MAAKTSPLTLLTCVSDPLYTKIYLGPDTSIAEGVYDSWLAIAEEFEGVYDSWLAIAEELLE